MGVDVVPGSLDSTLERPIIRPMSPWEVAPLYLILPMVFAFVWFHDRYGTEGLAVPEFEAWCKTARPVVFAARCARGEAGRVASALEALLGPKREVLNHRGRHPWTLYLFQVAIEHTDDRVVVRVVHAQLRRKHRRPPELGDLVDRILSEEGVRLKAAWMHAELRADDEDPGAGRRERGWLTQVVGGLANGFEPTQGLPHWVASTTPSH